ncbi:MAG: hypothetical protein OEZ14_00975 [Acidimicrobiia bacterium]|nr:hypothetical protein [Acidimicrobiia bacterium]
MTRPVRYTSPDDEQLVEGNVRAHEISQRLIERTRSRIEGDQLGDVVDDPLAALIEDARAKS